MDAAGDRAGEGDGWRGREEPSAQYAALFDATYPAVRRYAHHRGLRGADADDVVAEVMLVAWRRLRDVPVDDPIPWLFAVARNVWRNHQRSERRRERLVGRLPAPAVEPAVEPVDRDGADRIVIALRSLGAGDREVLLLVAWDGLTSDQLATTLGCSPGAARVRLHRARSRLAAALDTEAPEADPPRAVTPDVSRTDLLHVSTPEGPTR